MLTIDSAMGQLHGEEGSTILHYEGNWNYASIKMHVRVVICGWQVGGSPTCLERSKVLKLFQSMVALLNGLTYVQHDCEVNGKYFKEMVGHFEF